MKLEGSCHCGAVHFSVNSSAPYPYMRCYCSICRKTSGGGGYSINLMADASTLVVHGQEHITVFHARMADGSSSSAERRFCARCGSALWVFDSRWPEMVYPFASAIDSELPAAPERNHIMLGSKAGWVPLPEGESEHHFEGYPDASIVDWHRVRGLLEE